MQRKYVIALTLAGMAIIADQVSKTLIRATLSPMRALDLMPGFFEFRYAMNTGIAFGLFDSLPFSVKLPLFTGITLVAVGIIWHLLRQAPSRSVRLPVALGFVLSGAVGNLIDRYRWGGVVDFIRVRAWPPSDYYWPTFNLADTFISIGIIILIIDTFFSSEPRPAPAEEPDQKILMQADDGDQASKAETTEG